ncbi:MAG: hypothetical protein ACR2N7_01025, partial [Acidimicrobiia bacterium]
MAWQFPKWFFRVFLAVFAVLSAVWVVTGWMHANAIREEFLIPGPSLVGYPLTVESNEAGRVVVTRTAESERKGYWGLEGQSDSATDPVFAQVSTIVRMADGSVER